MVRRVLPLLLFAFAIIISSANILTKYVGGPTLFLYSLAVIVGLWGLERWGLPLLSRLPERISTLLVGVVVVGVTGVMLLLYPLANSERLGPGSDRDEALNQATTSLLQGDYPYYQLTYLNNPITPMPGALLLAAPFVALTGSSIWQIPFWLIAFVVVLRRWFFDSRFLLLLLLSIFVLAPKVDHEIVTGGDFVTNAMYVLVAFVLLIESAARPRLIFTVLAALLAGITLSSRMNWLLLLPLLAAAIAERTNWRTALWTVGVVVLTFGAVTLPWYLYDPAGFSPLHTANKLRLLNQVIPYTAEITLGLTGLVTLYLAWKQKGYRSFFFNCALVQAIPVIAGILIPIPLLGLDFTYGTRYGSTYILFAAVAYWLWIQEQLKASSEQ